MKKLTISLLFIFLLVTNSFSASTEKTTVIIKVKTTIEQVAEEADNLFKGGNPLATQVESFFILNNTPVQNGYCRIVVTKETAELMQKMLAAGYVSEHAEVIKVEWNGQDIVQNGVDESGNPVYEEQMFKVGEQEIKDESGNVIGVYPVYLGRMSY